MNSLSLSKLKQELGAILRVHDASSMDLAAPLVDLGLDSLKAAEICALLEYSYDTVVPIEKFLENLSGDDLIKFIRGDGGT